MTLHVEIDAPTESGRTIPAGSTVEYLGHVICGMVLVRWNDQKEIIHPTNTLELNESGCQIGK